MKGFTLIELLVVVAIGVMLSAVAIIYGGAASRNGALSVESSKVAGFVFRAKQLALTTYAVPAAAGASTICGYGVSFNMASNTYALFAYMPDPNVYGIPNGSIPITAGGTLQYCPSVASTTATGVTANEMGIADQSAWNVPLAGGVQIVSGGAGDDLAMVLFIPPNPTTLLSRFPAASTILDPQTVPVLTSRVYLAVASTTRTTVTVNGDGEVDF